MKFGMNVLKKHTMTIVFIVSIVLLIFWIYSTWHRPNLRQQQQGKKQKYVNVIKSLENNVQSYQNAYQQHNIRDPKNELFIAKKLARLYRDGIPDKYDMPVRRLPDLRGRVPRPPLKQVPRFRDDVQRPVRVVDDSPHEVEIGQFVLFPLDHRQRFAELRRVFVAVVMGRDADGHDAGDVGVGHAETDRAECAERETD